MMGGWAGSPSRPFYGRDGLRAVPFFPLTRIENKSNGTEAVPPINRRTSAKMAILGGQLGDLPLPACTLHLCSFPYRSSSCSCSSSSSTKLSNPIQSWIVGMIAKRSAADEAGVTKRTHQIQSH
jgi:hypothetical protein